MRRSGTSRRRAAVGVLLAVGLALPITTSAALAAPVRGAAAKSVGPFAVGLVDVDLVDESRVTPANGPNAELPTRTLPTRIVYPAKGRVGPDDVENARAAKADGPFPLVVFAHGFRGEPDSYVAFMHELASHGYVVAAPEFPASRKSNPGGGSLDDFANQPGDMEFVIEELDTAPPKVLRGSVDADRVGLVGHSFGGGTVLSAAFNDCCAIDRRVRAAVDMAGIEWPIGSPGFFENRDQPPFMMIEGDMDETAHGSGPGIYAEANAPKFFLSVVGGTHTSPYVGDVADPQIEFVSAAVTAFLDRYVRGDKSALRRLERLVASSDGLGVLESEVR